MNRNRRVSILGDVGLEAEAGGSVAKPMSVADTATSPQKKKCTGRFQEWLDITKDRGKYEQDDVQWMQAHILKRPRKWNGSTKATSLPLLPSSVPASNVLLSAMKTKPAAFPKLQSSTPVLPGVSGASKLGKSRWGMVQSQVDKQSTFTRSKRNSRELFLSALTEQLKNHQKRSKNGRRHKVPALNIQSSLEDDSSDSDSNSDSMTDTGSSDDENSSNDDEEAILESIEASSGLDKSDLAPRDAFWADMRDKQNQMLSSIATPDNPQATYLKLCAEQNRRPEPFVAKIWVPVDGNVHLAGKLLGDRNCIAIASSLKYTKDISPFKSVDLSNNRLTDKGLVPLLGPFGLRKSHFLNALHHLTLSHNPLGPGAVRELCALMSASDCLTDLGVEGCGLNDKLIAQLCDTMASSTTLVTVNMGRNHVAPQGEAGRALASMLAPGGSIMLRSLSVTW